MAEFDHLQSEAYQLLVAEGKSRLKPCIENLEECITIEYFE